MRIRVLLLLVIALPVVALAQQSPAPAATVPSASSPESAAVPATAPPNANVALKTITIPAGTSIPLVLKQGISTKNARVGDPVYASTNFPVTVNNRIVIPAGTYVQGRIDALARAGRVKGRSELQVHFTSLIFPNGYTVLFPGAVESAPDTDSARVKNSEGTMEGEGTKAKDAGTIAATTGAGAGLGAAATHSVKGMGIGAGIGAAGGLIGTLLTRGNDLKLPAGSTVDMVLERPLVLDDAKLRARGD
jgi:hypothetical protein